MDTKGNKDGHTRQLLSLVKAHVPGVVQGIADKCMQGFGGMGLSQVRELLVVQSVNSTVYS
jgi:hypothetical protein